LDLKSRIFSKVPHVNMRDRLLAMAQIGNHEMNNIHVRKERLNELALETSTIAKIVVDVNGNVAHINQKARLLFSLNPKDIGRPLQDLEVSYRPVELRSLIEQAYSERRAITLTNVERRFQNGEVQYLDVVVTPLYDETNSPLGVAISFPDITPYHRLSDELQHSREEVQTTNEELQSSNEELETTNEELQSSNEELETTNEELQSTNEELETMNEELQSTNEELQTVNVELRTRTDELNHVNGFLQSVVGSLTSGAVVLNQNLNVLVWNHKAEDLWGLREDEVKGQSFLNLDIGLPVERLRPIIRSCLSGEVDHKEILLDATNRRGKPTKCRVSCSPLIAHNKQRQGVILLMEED
jgi:two-component system, chemotaxis family, CheB/CheR fusion protein